jgi:hypothetical protein
VPTATPAAEDPGPHRRDRQRRRCAIPKYPGARVAILAHLLGQSADTANRRQQLLLSLPPGGPESYTPIAGLNRINPEIALLYANRQNNTLTRDVNELEKADLIVRRGSAIRPKFERLFAFLPDRMPPPPTPEQEMMRALADASEPLSPAS